MGYLKPHRKELQNISVLLKRARSSVAKASKQITKEAFARAEDSIAAGVRHACTMSVTCLPESDFVAVLNTDCVLNLYRPHYVLLLCRAVPRSVVHGNIVHLA